ncbi:MAG: glycosyltransferase [Polynucleobacter sp.]|nr:glycosyltransferase [Polynucleobacter sp.]
MISFIVPAFNEELCLAATLKALHVAGHASNQAYEIVVADDASTDKTAEIALQNKAVLVSVAHRQIAATRNAGAKVASGDWFIFVDADTLVNESVVLAAVQAMQHGAVGGGSGMRFDEPTPLYARILLSLVVRLFRATGFAAGCFLFCTRSAFDAIGGFDNAYYGAEEIVMSRALKQQGNFLILKQTVTTSARKLRTYSLKEILLITYGIARRGTKAVKQRKGMEFWYAERRKDPRDGS